MTKPRKRRKVVTREDLANVLSDLLNLPRLGRQGTTYTVVKTILRAIVGALWRGETVRVDGFGRFEVHNLPARKRKLTFFYGLKIKDAPTEIVELPAGKRVIFKPSKALLRELNA